MQKIQEEIKKMFTPKGLKIILCIVGAMVILLLVFSAGMIVGFQKASFGENWGEHYNENFGMGYRKGGINNISNLGMMGYFPNAHGTTGKIIKLELPTIIVEDKDNTEKVVLINDDTKIQKMRSEIKNTDLKIDDFIVVIGSPNTQGQIEAKFIRVIPLPNF